MFGYVNLDKPNTLIKDYELYKAYYCGICKSLGKKTGLISRFSVNYDITFLSLLAHNYKKLQPKINKENCFAHPLNKKWCIVENDEIQITCAYINVILGFYKIEDDVLDNGGLKYRLAKLSAMGAMRKARKVYPELAEKVSEKYKKLQQLEKENASLGALAHAFGEILSDCGAVACGTNERNLTDLLTILGMWIYILDAVDDYHDDLKEKKFNPFIRANAPTKERFEEIYNDAFEILSDLEHNIMVIYDKMEITISEAPLSNVIYLGLHARRESVLSAFRNKVVKEKN